MVTGLETKLYEQRLKELCIFCLEKIRNSILFKSSPTLLGISLHFSNRSTQSAQLFGCSASDSSQGGGLDISRASAVNNCLLPALTHPSLLYFSPPFPVSAPNLPTLEQLQPFTVFSLIQHNSTLHFAMLERLLFPFNVTKSQQPECFPNCGSRPTNGLQVDFWWDVRSVLIFKKNCKHLYPIGRRQIVSRYDVIFILPN